MNILITGATGSIGKVLTGVLGAKRHTLAIVARNSAKANELFGDGMVTVIDLEGADWPAKVVAFAPKQLFIWRRCSPAEMI
ncbi:hypothetical protein MUN82_13460 [Hymenobacter aerilatus]|uniref:NAD-dependent epimerase/dehydratase domain-containing protein n=1 Tax=Hymenobacter aerilatus TaxID=2932251 RepID=A0A8T9SPH5_9BACT|nr:NAD-dependent epimerase/dehydratase family protein [Hymenobacter aerilatus]UOR03952.1 hypothetical protein MUN82_13460 [Hymenobacter aerilatus]